MTEADLVTLFTGVAVVVGALLNALMTHRVHMQFNSRFDQLIIAAEQRGASEERAASDLRVVKKAEAEADERADIRAENRTSGKSPRNQDK